LIGCDGMRRKKRRIDGRRGERKKKIDGRRGEEYSIRYNI
jgi:hypothetical protein